MARILVVDDEVGIRELLFEILYDEGHTVELAENATAARAARQRARFDLVLLDIWMPDTDGVSLLKEWVAAEQLDMPVIMMSGHATIDTAVEATRIGAIDFLEKPITLQRLLKAVEAGLLRGRSPLLAAANKGALAAHRVTPPSTLPPSQSAPSTLDMSDDHLGGIALDQPLRDARDEFERAYFAYHLACEGHSMTRLSEKSGLERTHLYRKLKQLGIEATRKGAAAKVERNETPGTDRGHSGYVLSSENYAEGLPRASPHEPAETYCVTEEGSYGKRYL